MTQNVDRPLTGRRIEIEITPEMIEAGACALTSSLGGIEFFCDWDALAREVFEAMCNPYGSEPFLSRRPGPSKRPPNHRSK